MRLELRRVAVMALLTASACSVSTAVSPSTVFSCRTSADCFDGFSCRAQTCVEGPPEAVDAAVPDAGAPSAIDALDALSGLALHFDFRRGLELDADGGVITWHGTGHDGGVRVVSQPLESRRPQLYTDGIGRPPERVEVYFGIPALASAQLAADILGPTPHLFVFIGKVSSRGSTANAGLTALSLTDVTANQLRYFPGLLRDGRVRSLRGAFMPFSGRAFADDQPTVVIYRYSSDAADNVDVSAGAQRARMSEALQPVTGPVYGLMAQTGDYQGGLVEARMQMLLLYVLPGATRAEVDARADEVLRLLRDDPLYAPLVE
ncbi:MAG: hypothetical protein JNG84_15290 [Archangium sp.]|nr:hypothetical protein [Archangium sp.]